MNRSSWQLHRWARCLVWWSAASLAAAHQDFPAVGADELGRTPPPLRGSATFLREGLPLLRVYCTDALSGKLDEAERSLRDAELVRWGAANGADPRIADALRWRAEQAVVEVLTEISGDTAIDLTKADDPVLRKVELAPQQNTIVLRVEAGEGQPELSMIDWELTGEAFDRTTELVVADEGTTFVVVRLAGVPMDNATIRFAIRRRSREQPDAWRALELVTPRCGHLAIDLCDDVGKPTHALIAIRSVIGGALHEPPGAIDLRAQLNDIVGPPVSEPGNGYAFFLPGKKRGRFWIVPPHIETTLPEGEWDVFVQRGPEQIPIIDRVRIEADEWTRRTYEIERWIDQPSRGWWSGDDHVHARLMSGKDASRLLDYAEAVDLHVANILEMGDPFRTYYAQRGFGEEFRSNRGDYWLVPGQEDPRSDLGHAIGLNLAEKVRVVDEYLQNRRLADRIHAGGGLYGHTHVGANACFVHREMALFTPAGVVDFNSIMQAALGTELYYDFLNLGFKMTASAGSDTPYGGTVGTVRVYARTGSTTKLDPEAWFNALRRGATFVTSGPMLEFEVEDVGPGETLNLTEPRPLKVVAKASGAPGWSSPSKLEIIQFGDPVASAASDDADGRALELHDSIHPGQGCWVAARATGHDGSEAHTTPVYVSVNGDWHGDRAKTRRLVARQLEVLDEIETVLASAEEVVREGRNPLDIVSRNTAQQADAVREQVAKARSYYLELLQRHAEPN